MTNMSSFFPNYHLTQEERIKRWAVMYEAQKEDKWLWAFTDWMTENYWIPGVATVLYLLFIFFGTRYMKTRNEFNLQTPLVIWNGLLAVFSIYGSYKLVPIFLGAWLDPKKGLIYELCHNEIDMNYPMTLYFVLSKIPELFDTVFIVLRKRPLRFLQYYHHVATMWFCWIACARRLESGGAYAVMNFFVHAIMYTYFMCAALHIRWPSWARLSITVLQVSQMVVGIVFVTIPFFSCFNDPFTLYFGLFMYISYFVLFAQLLYDNCVPQESSKTKKE